MNLSLNKKEETIAKHIVISNRVSSLIFYFLYKVDLFLSLDHISFNFWLLCIKKYRLNS